MDKKKIPYAVRVSAALLAGKTDESFNIIGEALTDIVGKISKISQNYCYIDLPFVIAALRVTANAFESTIDDKGKELARTVYEKTDGVVINAAELMKQVREDGNDDREKAD
ncbi:hypothetical protein [Faecalibacterium sp. PGM34]|jgi:hypothetical protein|nr:MAG: hypothetical protein OGM80_05620 [Oscillospiraceae bacterium]DAQ43421.1 MAG TPA: hypothetical protein [Caudoviricetes sp.]DAZ01232.1 MAG TPA: hypothetical protein [Caudoviricetes sp.]